MPPKIKIWLWLIWHNSIATNDNMYKRGSRGDIKCSFCDEGENIHHLFFLCPAAKYMWTCGVWLVYYF
jgi:Zn finger protein HypA/HybF involved in hydrogenase expression